MVGTWLWEKLKGKTKAEIPVSYIIALILGIAVVAILGYWFFVVSGSATGTASGVECSTAKFVYCNDLLGGGEPDSAEVKQKCGSVPTTSECQSLVGTA